MRAPNSTPIVRSCTGWKRLSVNWSRRQDLPTPEGKKRGSEGLGGMATANYGPHRERRGVSTVFILHHDISSQKETTVAFSRPLSKPTFASCLRSHPHSAASKLRPARDSNAASLASFTCEHTRVPDNDVLEEICVSRHVDQLCNDALRRYRMHTRRDLRPPGLPVASSPL